MIRKLVRVLEWLDAAINRTSCPSACDEGHTYRWPCGMKVPQR